MTTRGDLLRVADDLERVGGWTAAESIVREAADESERLHSWQGLLELLDEHWPEDIFPVGDPTDERRDTGPRLVAAMRWIEQLLAENAKLRDSVKAADDGREEWESTCKTAEDENERLRQNHDDLLRLVRLRLRQTMTEPEA